MEYTIQKLARLAGISTRTLRYYDEIGLLKPVRINSSGYRIYGIDEVDRLQLIMFYRELDVPLRDIQRLVNDLGFDEQKALESHYKLLKERREQLDVLIDTVEKTLKARSGGMSMKDIQKFEGFKARVLRENEAAYGKEIQDKYPSDWVKKSKEKFQQLSAEDYEQMQAIEGELFEKLKEKVPTAEIGKLHRAWLSFAWPNYSKEAHLGLSEMYGADSRFADYYDSRAGVGATDILRRSIELYGATL